MNQAILATGVMARYLGRMCLVIHEVAEGTVDRSLSDRSIRNAPGVDILGLSIVYYGLVDELRVITVHLQ